jgi:hypothetical protein
VKARYESEEEKIVRWRLAFSKNGLVWIALVVAAAGLSVILALPRGKGGGGAAESPLPTATAAATMDVSEKIEPELLALVELEEQDPEKVQEQAAWGFPFDQQGRVSVIIGLDPGAMVVRRRLPGTPVGQQEASQLILAYGAEIYDELYYGNLITAYVPLDQIKALAQEEAVTDIWLGKIIEMPEDPVVPTRTPSAESLLQDDPNTSIHAGRRWGHGDRGNGIGEDGEVSTRGGDRLEGPRRRADGSWATEVATAWVAQVPEGLSDDSEAAEVAPTGVPPVGEERAGALLAPKEGIPTRAAYPAPPAPTPTPPSGYPPPPLPPTTTPWPTPTPTFTPSPSPPPPPTWCGIGFFDDPVAGYGGGDWTVVDDPGGSFGERYRLSPATSPDPPPYATWSFNASYLSIGFKRGPEFGEFVVKIDGETVKTLNAYALEPIGAQWTTGFLGYGDQPHVVRLETLTGPPLTRLGVDYFIARYTLPENCAAPTPTWPPTLTPTPTSSPTLTPTPTPASPPGP